MRRAKEVRRPPARLEFGASRDAPAQAGGARPREEQAHDGLFPACESDRRGGKSLATQRQLEDSGAAPRPVADDSQPDAVTFAVDVRGPGGGQPGDWSRHGADRVGRQRVLGSVAGWGGRGRFGCTVVPLIVQS